MPVRAVGGDHVDTDLRPASIPLHDRLIEGELLTVWRVARNLVEGPAGAVEIAPESVLGRGHLPGSAAARVHREDRLIAGRPLGVVSAGRALLGVAVVGGEGDPPVYAGKGR